MDEEVSAFAAYSAGKKKKKLPKQHKKGNNLLINKALLPKKNKKKMKQKKDLTEDSTPKEISSKTGKIGNVIKKNDNIKKTSKLKRQQGKDDSVEHVVKKKAKEPPTLRVVSGVSGERTASNLLGKNQPHPHASKQEPENSKKLAPPNDSIEEGINILRYLLAPVNINTFFTQFWEKEPCLIQRDDPSYFSNLISFAAIHEMLLENHVEYTENLDITSYNQGVRETLNPQGRAMPGDVWDFFKRGCSIRLLNPQVFIPALFKLNTTLQEYFHCLVGANVYLTPPCSQGFAPHYDDIEAFVLQVEGEKRWKLYNPRNIHEVLPRISSPNFNQKEIGEPILDRVLKPGDILYFPRGTIHQAKTEGNQHSLHITLSVYQRQSFADLLEILLPKMLSRAIEEKVALRRGLPLDIWYNFGIVHSDSQSKDREKIVETCRSLFAEVFNELPLDDAVDEMAKKFQHDALPPDVTASEKPRTVAGVKTYLDESGQLKSNLNINAKTAIRLLRANILRMVEEEGKINIYYYSDNSKRYHIQSPNLLEIDPDDAPAVDYLIKSYPEYVAVGDLPIAGGGEFQVSVVEQLFNRGLLMLEEPLS